MRGLLAFPFRLVAAVLNGLAWLPLLASRGCTTIARGSLDIANRIDPQEPLR